MAYFDGAGLAKSSLWVSCVNVVSNLVLYTVRSTEKASPDDLCPLLLCPI